MSNGGGVVEDLGLVISNLNTSSDTAPAGAVR